MARMAVFIVCKGQSKVGYPTVLRQSFGVKEMNAQYSQRAGSLKEFSVLLLVTFIESEIGRKIFENMCFSTRI